ncbi:hypothetical protein ABBQ32_007080 [Trebouxia sp. C0010 RCD-2024]
MAAPIKKTKPTSYCKPMTSASSSNFSSLCGSQQASMSSSLLSFACILRVKWTTAGKELAKNLVSNSYSSLELGAWSSKAFAFRVGNIAQEHKQVGGLAYQAVQAAACTFPRLHCPQSPSACFP